MSRLLLSAVQAKPLLERRKSLGPFRSSADLNLTRLEVEITEHGVLFPQGRVSWEAIDEIAEHDRKVFECLGEGNAEPEIQAVSRFSETTGWVRTLCPTESAPTVLVSGIPMHRIAGTDPMTDTREKMRALGPLRGRVLDTATGLGYTAIAAAKTASEVVTIELDPTAIELAKVNPWSQELFMRPNIQLKIGDALDIVPELSGGSFCAVIHDPPTLALGGELYSEAFYRELRRVLNRGGRLFHYIGDPDSGLGKRQWPGVIRRLSRVGFKRIVRHPAAYGVTAVAE